MKDDELRPHSGSAADSGDKPFRVPSFDELMGFAAPAAQNDNESHDAAAPVADEGELAAEEEPNIFSLPTTPVAATPRPATPRPAHNVDEQPPSMAQPQLTDDEVVPLILPGFSSDGGPKQPLPPLFQPGQAHADTLADDLREAFGAAPEAAAPVVDYDALPPTQPVPLVATEPIDTVLPPTESTDVFAALGLGEDSVVDEPEDEPAVAPVPAAASVPAVAPVPAVASPVVAASAVAASAAASTTQSVSAPASARQNPSTSSPRRSSATGGDDSYEKISVTGGERGVRRALPWIIVGGGVIIALIASIFVINALRGGAESESTPTPAPTTTEPAPEPTTEPSPTPTEEPTPAPEPDEVPVVEVGPSWWIPITQWGLDVEKSQRLGTVTYSGLTDQGLTLEIELAQSLPDSCAAAREGWGLAKNADGTLEAVRPLPRCTDNDAAAVYDTIWGLVDHMAKSARAAS